MALNSYTKIGKRYRFFIIKFSFLGLRFAELQNLVKIGPETTERQKRTEGYNLNMQIRKARYKLLVSTFLYFSQPPLGLARDSPPQGIEG
jgi:hypothetical protein